MFCLNQLQIFFSALKNYLLFVSLILFWKNRNFFARFPLVFFPVLCHMYSAASLCVWVFSSQAVSHCCRHSSWGAAVWDSVTTSFREVHSPHIPATRAMPTAPRAGTVPRRRIWDEVLAMVWFWPLMVEQLECCTETDSNPNVRLARLIASPHTSQGFSWHGANSPWPLPTA